MQQIKPFNLSGDFVATDLKEFGNLLINLINVSSQTNQIELSDLRFSAGKMFDVNRLLTFDEILENRIPIIDYLIYLKLSNDQKQKVRWELNIARPAYTQSQVAYSVLCLYVMVVTRNKAMPDNNESIPMFLSKFMKLPMKLEEICDCLSNNDLNLFTHSWVKEIPVKSLSIALQNRFRQGIAGMRLFSIFRDYTPDMEIDESTKVTVDRIKDLVNGGPYWEMHTLFQPIELSSMSINSSLNNLMLVCYTDKKLSEMKHNKSIYRYPKYTAKGEQYKNWDMNFFSYFKSKVI